MRTVRCFDPSLRGHCTHNQGRSSIDATRPEPSYVHRDPATSQPPARGPLSWHDAELGGLAASRRPHQACRGKLGGWSLHVALARPQAILRWRGAREVEMDRRTDSELIVAIRSDSSAFEELYRRHMTLSPFSPSLTVLLASATVPRVGRLSYATHPHWDC